MVQAYRYAFPGADPNVQIVGSDYDGLLATNTNLLLKIKAELSLQGSNSHTVKPLDPYILDASIPGFASLLQPNGNLTFYISSDDPVFYDMVRPHLICLTF